MNPTLTEAIIAIATPLGQGGVGIVRISGEDAHIQTLMTHLCGQSLSPRRASYLPFLDAQKKSLDQGIALYFPAPHSYTGESVLELQGHGGSIVMQMILQAALNIAQNLVLPLRMARAGEFTERAFLNHKIDLAQAESIADLISATSVVAAKRASESLSGKFSKQIHELVDELIGLRTLIEATLDFPEEEIDLIEAAQVAPRLSQLQQKLQAILQVSRSGKILRDGISIVLVGQPNVGKSSLMNALAEDDIAIVTPIAGTTRDKLTESILIEGIQVNITDTAGLRETNDMVEKIGIERTWQAIAKADVVLHLQTPHSDPSHEQEDSLLMQKILQTVQENTPYWVVINKIDLLPSTQVHHIDDKHIAVSAMTGQGLPELKTHLLKSVGWENTENVILARERHLLALQHALQHLNNAGIYLNNQQLEILAEELRLAQEQLSQITGEFLPDDLLGEIFTQFCIGK